MNLRGIQFHTYILKTQPMAFENPGSSTLFLTKNPGNKMNNVDLPMIQAIRFLGGVFKYPFALIR